MSIEDIATPEQVREARAFMANAVRWYGPIVDERYLLEEVVGLIKHRDDARAERDRLIAELRSEGESLIRASRAGLDRDSGSGRFTEAQVLMRLAEHLNAIADRGGKETT